jgi:hypothetical protein
LVDNITTYEYDEIFTGAISIIKNYRSPICAKNAVPSKQGPFLNNPGFCKSSFTVENDDLIYKAYSIDRVLSKHNQDDIIMFCLKEIYFHNLTRDALIANNVEHVIIPEMKKYGKIVLENGDIVIFYNTIRYTDEQPPVFNNAKSEPIKFIKEMEKTHFIVNRGMVALKDTLSQLNIYHNDISENSGFENDNFFERVIQFITDKDGENDDCSKKDHYETLIKEMIGKLEYEYEHADVIQPKPFIYNDMSNNIFTPNNNNIFKYNDKIVVIDFEKAGASEYAIRLIDYLNYVNN